MDECAGLGASPRYSSPGPPRAEGTINHMGFVGEADDKVLVFRIHQYNPLMMGIQTSSFTVMSFLS